MKVVLNRILIVFVLLYSTISMAGADTRTVKSSVEIPMTPERALQAFIRSDDLHKWWRVSRSMVDPQPGGLWSVVWDDYGDNETNHAWIGVVEDVSSTRLLIKNLVMIEPGRPLFGPLQLEIVTTPVPDGHSQLTVYHRGYQYGDDWDWMHDTVTTGWKHVLSDLRGWAENSSEKVGD
jgi:uncharacterized protein YndB with AHSA1/START domain